MPGAAARCRTSRAFRSSCPRTCGRRLRPVLLGRRTWSCLASCWASRCCWAWEPTFGMLFCILYHQSRIRSGHCSHLLTALQQIKGHARGHLLRTRVADLPPSAVHHLPHRFEDLPADVRQAAYGSGSPGQQLVPLTQLQALLERMPLQRTGRLAPPELQQDSVERVVHQALRQVLQQGHPTLRIMRAGLRSHDGSQTSQERGSRLNKYKYIYIYITVARTSCSC